MQNLWVFSFEYAGIIKVGGLGEVPSNQTKWLADQYKITLFMPSHGVHSNLSMQKKLNLIKMDIELKTSITALKLGLGDTTEDVHIEFHEGKINGIRVILLVGKNKFSSKMLNDPIVYSPESLTGKFVLYSLGVKYYIHEVLTHHPKQVPHIIHCHDHHGVPALICCRQMALKANTDVATVITIHLMTWPRKNLDFLRVCGVEDTVFDIYLGSERRTFTLEEFYLFCKGSEVLDPTLEKVGVYFADLVTSVSEDYALSNVVSNLGGGWIYPKTDFTWNGCDWNYESMMENVLTTYKAELKEINEKDWNTRNNLRKFLLTQGFSHLQKTEPIIPSKKIQAYLQEHLTFFPYIKESNGKFSGKLANFDEDGSLVIMTGRVSKQKGIDVLLDAIPLILKKHPDTKFIFSVLPTEFSIPDIESYLDRIKAYSSNVRMIFGKVFSLFFLMHLAADVYCAPSRWEPFGITALEGSVSKAIVVASQTGGLQEIVLDVDKWKSEATGMLVQVEKVEMLANSIADIITIIKIEQSKNKTSRSTLTQTLNNPILQKLVQTIPNLSSKMRENANKRVETQFRWNIVTQKLPKLYNQALKNRGYTK